jgi:H+-translocating diphosphatase
VKSYMRLIWPIQLCSRGCALQDVEAVLKVQLALTSAVMTAVLYPVAAWALPETIHIQGVPGVVTPLTCFLCIISGLWGGCIIGFITEYYTSHSYQPVITSCPIF